MESSHIGAVNLEELKLQSIFESTDLIKWWLFYVCHQIRGGIDNWNPVLSTNQ